MHLHLRGVSGRSGIFLSGKPQQLILFDDGLVTRQASGWMALVPLSSPGQQLDNKVAAQQGRYASARDYAASQPRSQFTAYADISRATLTRERLQSKLAFDTAHGSATHSYQPTFAPDEVLIPLLHRFLGPAFEDHRTG